MAKVKQFRIFNADEQTCIGKYDTTKEAYGVSKSLDMGLAHYFIDDVVNDIEIGIDEFNSAFERGESPSDLTFF